MQLIIGATGTVGRSLVEHLVDAGERVRAVTHRTGAHAGGRVEVVEADLRRPASLAPHLDGVSSVFLLWPFTSAEGVRAVLETIGARTRRVVCLSAAAAADDPDSSWARVEGEVEACVEEWTMVRPTGFAKNTMMWADQMRSGDVVRWPFGRAGRSLVHERDIAAVAAAAMTQPGHVGRRLLITGPQCLTQLEQVAVIGKVLGRLLRWEELEPPAARDLLGDAFGDAAFAELALASWRVSSTAPNR
jgi:uncharacterized protein YbjT (DUF2867 family)